MKIQTQLTRTCGMQWKQCSIYCIEFPHHENRTNTNKQIYATPQTSQKRRATQAQNQKNGWNYKNQSREAALNHHQGPTLPLGTQCKPASGVGCTEPPMRVHYATRMQCKLTSGMGCPKHPAGTCPATKIIRRFQLAPVSVWQFGTLIPGVELWNTAD